MPPGPGRGRLSRRARRARPAPPRAPHRAGHARCRARSSSRRSSPASCRRAWTRSSAGVLPTPAVAFLIPALGAAGGAVLSASHNPVRGQRGEALLGRRRQAAGRLGGRDRGAPRRRSRRGRGRPARGSGGCARCRGAERRYLDGLRASLPAGFDLAGLRVVLDCAHGATYRVAPRLFRVARGRGETRSACGRAGRTSTAASGRSIPRGSRRASAPTPGAIGLAFDGDGDRLIVGRRVRRRP